MASGYAYAATGAFQIVSGLQQAELMRESGRFAQQVAEMNAQYAELDAYEAEKFALTESARYQTQIDSTISDQRTMLAAEGVDITSGTAKAIQEETKLTGFLNTLDIEAQGRAKAMGLRRQAASFRIGGAQNVAQANINASATRANAVVGGIGSGLNAYDRWK